MSTINTLTLEKDSKRLSLIQSPRHSLENIMGVKSEAEIRMASEAKQKKIDDLVAYAEKVLPQNKMLA